MISFFDIETNGLLDVLDRVHCLVVETSQGDFYSCSPHNGTPIEVGLEVLHKSDLIIAHNAQGFDIPALVKLYPDIKLPEYRDTLIMSRLMFPDLWDRDMSMRKAELKGSHSLDAWGRRLGVLKDKYNGSWDEWTLEMQKYCEQDVRVLKTLWDRLKKTNFPDSAIQLEHSFADCLRKQMINGVPFAYKKAETLLDTLTKRKEEILKEAESVFPEQEIKETFIPKRDNKSKGYVKGVPYTKVTKTTINLGSRDQIGKYFLQKYDWQPKELTASGKPKLNEEIFQNLPFPEAQIVAQFLEINKRIGQLSAGDNALLRCQVDGYIYGRINHNGARSGRCTHFAPNVSQIPSPGASYGKEFRDLIHAPAGKVFVGADLKGIELRVLAHYLSLYDGGEYVKEVLDGDPHTRNQEAAGLPTRSIAKRFLYATMYGAGQEKLGSIIKPEATREEQKRLGKSAKMRFQSGVQGYFQLQADLKATFLERGYITGLDGRKLIPKAEYTLLNTLLQSAGAIIAKKWTVLVNEDLADYKTDFKQHLHVHDEILLSCSEEDSEFVAKVCANAAIEAGEFFNLNIPIEADAKIGQTWGEVH